VLRLHNSDCPSNALDYSRQVIFWIVDMVLVLPAVGLIFDFDIFWFIVLDTIASTQLIVSSHRKAKLEEQSMVRVA